MLQTFGNNFIKAAPHYPTLHQQVPYLPNPLLAAAPVSFFPVDYGKLDKIKKCIKFWYNYFFTRVKYCFRNNISNTTNFSILLLLAATAYPPPQTLLLAQHLPTVSQNYHEKALHIKIRPNQRSIFFDIFTEIFRRLYDFDYWNERKLYRARKSHCWIRKTDQPGKREKIWRKGKCQS